MVSDYKKHKNYFFSLQQNEKLWYFLEQELEDNDTSTVPKHCQDDTKNYYPNIPINHSPPSRGPPQFNTSQFS